MTNVAIVGASGYTGVELTRILCNHPHISITAATSRQYDGQPLSEIFPNLREKIDITCENLSVDELSERADIFFTAVPHKTAMGIVPQLIEAGKKVVDLSADFRLRNIPTYEEWYQKHTAPTLVKDAVYGLPELYRKAIQSTSLVANPGCYPTSIILGLAPLLKNDVIAPDSIIADSKSGTSGAGRAAKVGTLFCEVTDGFRAYNVGAHRHTPEIEQEVNALCPGNAQISFTPHLLPISRGILSTVYAQLQTDVNSAAIRDLYETMYGSEPFIRLLPEGQLPATQYVRGSNFCDIAFKVDPRTNRIVILSTIDNIVKGAAGQAVQNMNIMCGFEESAGLNIVPFFP